MAVPELKHRRFAAFDIDGTIFRWQLYHELFDAFVNEGIITHEHASATVVARDTWRERKGEYLAYEHELIHATQDAIDGIDEDYFNQIADGILERKGHHTYRYTLDLLKKLKSQGYIIIAISGSHQQLVDRFASIHDIDISVGRNHTIKDGKFTPLATEVPGNKDKILQTIVSEHELSWDESYAVGDSGGDIAMLRLATNPIAFNPDKTLYIEAQAQGWPIVVERKSIAYTLEKGPDGSYVLA